MTERENHAVFIELYNSTYDSIFKYILSRCDNAFEAPDILQKTYLNYYERFRKYGHANNPLKYLYKIAKSELNKYYNFAAKQKNNVPVFSKTEDDWEFEAMEAMLEQEMPEDRRLDTQQIWRYIQGLDALTSKIFILYFYHDEKLAAIAKMLAINESTVKNRLYRTIEKMKAEFNFNRQEGGSK